MMKIARIPVEKIELPRGWENSFSVKYRLVTRIGSLSDGWAKKVINRHPPSVVLQGDQYLLVGGLHSYLMALTSFPNKKIIVLLEADIDDPLEELYLTELGSILSYGYSKGAWVKNYVKGLWLLLTEGQLQELSEKIVTGVGFGEVSGVNRRSLTRKARIAADSEFVRLSL